MRTRGFTALELLVVVLVIAVAVTLLTPALLKAKERSRQAGCGDNLKKIALAATQYSQDMHAFPHRGPLASFDGGVGSQVAAKAIRSLTYYGYCDDPLVYQCPSSTDAVATLSDAAKKDPRCFDWNNASTAAPSGAIPLPPLVAPDGAQGDAELSLMTNLSYGWTKRGYTSTSPASSLLAGDKGRNTAQESGCSRNPGSETYTGKIAGNHRSCILCVSIDGTVTRVVPSGDLMNTDTKLVETGPSGGGLGVRDDNNQ